MNYKIKTAVSATCIGVAALLSPLHLGALSIGDVTSSLENQAGDAISDSFSDMTKGFNVGDLLDGSSINIDPGKFIEDASDTYISQLFGLDIDIRCRMDDVGVPTVDICGMAENLVGQGLSAMPDFLTLGPCQAQLSKEKNHLRNLLDKMCEKKIDDAVKSIKNGDIAEVDFDDLVNPEGDDSSESEGSGNKRKYRNGLSKTETYDKEDSPLNPINMMTSKKVSKKIKSAYLSDDYDNFIIFEQCIKNTSGSREDVYEACSKMTTLEDLSEDDLSQKHYRDGVQAEYLALSRTIINYFDISDSLEQAAATYYVTHTLPAIKEKETSSEMEEVVLEDEQKMLLMVNGKKINGDGSENDSNSTVTQATRMIEQRYKRLAGHKRILADNSDRIVMPSLSKMKVLSVDEQRSYLAKFARNQTRDALELYETKAKIEHEKTLLAIAAKKAYISSRQYYAPITKKKIKEMLEAIDAVVQ